MVLRPRLGHLIANSNLDLTSTSTLALALALTLVIALALSLTLVIALALSLTLAPSLTRRAAFWRRCVYCERPSPSSTPGSCSPS